MKRHVSGRLIGPRSLVSVRGDPWRNELRRDVSSGSRRVRRGDSFGGVISKSTQQNCNVSDSLPSRYLLFH